MSSDTHILDSDSVLIDPATKQKQDAIIVAVGGSTPAPVNADGLITVGTPGTAVPLSGGSVPCKRVFVQALGSNEERVVVGASTVDAISYRGKTFHPTQGDMFMVSNLNLLFVDAINVGEGIAFYYEV